MASRKSTPSAKTSSVYTVKIGDKSYICQLIEQKGILAKVKVIYDDNKLHSVLLPMNALKSILDESV
jgi:hypothetical protein